MDRACFDGVEVSYEVQGDGQPVVLLHAAAFTTWFRPLVDRMPRFSMSIFLASPLFPLPESWTPWACRFSSARDTTR